MQVPEMLKLQKPGEMKSFTRSYFTYGEYKQVRAETSVVAETSVKQHFMLVLLP